MTNTTSIPNVTIGVVDDDATLLRRSLDDPAAFDLVFRRHHPQVFRYVVSRVGIDAAEEVVAETALAAFDTRRRFEPARAESALPWLLGIATRRISRHRASEGAWTATCIAASNTASSDPDRTDISDSRIDAARVAEQLAEALSELPRRLRDPLLLHVLGGLSYDEVSTALALPVGTVRSRISRARVRLAGRLDGVNR